MTASLSGGGRTAAVAAVLTLACLAAGVPGGRAAAAPPPSASATPVPAGTAALPGPPPISQSAFPLETTGASPVDNDRRIPSPSTPAQPLCSVTLTAPSDGSVTAVQGRINSDVAAGPSFRGDAICLRGTFRAPIHVRSKTSSAKLTVARAPGAVAIFDLSGRPPRAADEDPGAHDGADVGAIEIGGSRGVELYGLVIRNWVTRDPGLAPAGIYVTTTRADPSMAVPASPCYLTSADHVCSDIFLYANTIQTVKNLAPACGNLNIGAYGIAVKSFGGTAAQALQHVVIEGNTITGTATGGSETLTVNGDVSDFLIAGNTIANVNNIGIDLIGWETGGNPFPGGHSASQARHGLISSNRIANVDTTANLTGYGHSVGGRCVPGDDQAGGLYADGGSYLWLANNRLTETNHGIELGAEHAGRLADHLLVTGNSVVDGRGTTFSASSYAGHAAGAFIIGGVPQDGASPSFVSDVYAHDNTFTNQSQYYNDGSPNLQTGKTAAVVNVTGGWRRLWLLANTVSGLGPPDTLNPLLVVDTRAAGDPTVPPGVVVDCNRYNNLSTTPDPPSADNFDTPPGNSFGGFADYRDHNQMATSEHGVGGWDAHGAAAARPPCPFAVPAWASGAPG